MLTVVAVDSKNNILEIFCLYNYASQAPKIIKIKKGGGQKLSCLSKYRR